MNIILTGAPGVGKTRLVNEVVEELDVDIGGLVAKRDEDNGEIQEFTLKDLETGDEDVLASRDGDSGPVAKGFHINTETLNRMSKDAIEQAIRRGDLIVIDMIGTIEMHSSLFRESVRDAFRGSEHVLAVVQQEYVDEYKDEGEVIELTHDNYDEVKEQVLEKLESRTGPTG
ncbi:MAG: nucleoside-triphosphatase [Candidatus Nanohaloarchaea archaeon]|nr:nucleoside-triphosphatase [Candidatus Nanohaloarchaea archaeon]